MPLLPALLTTSVLAMGPQWALIDLPYPRDETTREADRYYALVTEVREAIRGRPGGGGDLAARSRADGAFG